MLKKLLAGCLVALGACAGVAMAAPARPHFQKVMIVILENTEYDDAMRQPFLKALAKRGALLSDYHAVAHPSEPNYVALVAGDYYGIKDDGQYDLDGKTVADLLEAKHRSWKVYAESYPGHCFTGMHSGTYARKHEPFMSFKNISTDAARCSHIVNASELDGDIRKGTLPDYSLYIPDMNNDGHDTTVAYANDWLKKAFGPRLSDPAFTRGMLFVVTFDESNIYPPQGTNRVATVLVGDSVRPGFVSRTPYTHYSLLRTVEDGFGLGTLGKNDEKARAIQDVWKK